jgi:hypothetical protein
MLPHHVTNFATSLSPLPSAETAAMGLDLPAPHWQVFDGRMLSPDAVAQIDSLIEEQAVAQGRSGKSTP